MGAGAIAMVVCASVDGLVVVPEGGFEPLVVVAVVVGL